MVEVCFFPEGATTFPFERGVILAKLIERYSDAKDIAEAARVMTTGISAGEAIVMPVKRLSFFFPSAKNIAINAAESLRSPAFKHNLRNLIGEYKMRCTVDHDCRRAIEKVQEFYYLLQ